MVLSSGAVERAGDRASAATIFSSLAMKTLILALSVFSGSAFAACEEPKIGTKAAPFFSPPLSVVVIGTGRLQFYSAPNSGCTMKGVFVIPKDELITYAQSGGWSSVMYSNPETGNTLSGWVKSSRLKETGTVGPRQ
jgi:hypothetical protein